MDIFDMNCMLGPTRTDREPCFRTPEALLAEMDRVGIAEALVYASHAAMGHPADANAWVVEATRAHPRLHPCWAVLPPGTGELPEPEELVAQMRAQGVRAARMFPAVHGFPLLERILRPLLEALSGAGDSADSGPGGARAGASSRTGRGCSQLQKRTPDCRWC